MISGKVHFVQDLTGVQKSRNVPAGIVLNLPISLAVCFATESLTLLLIGPHCLVFLKEITPKK